MLGTRIYTLLLSAFLAGTIQAQTNSFSLRWLDLLENDWPGFEREDSKQAAAKLVDELKDELGKKDQKNAGECNYLLCEINYYQKAYDSSIVYGKEALRTGFRDSGMVHYKMALSYEATNQLEQALHSIDQALADKPGKPGEEVYYYEKKKLTEQLEKKK